jgi:hypothetical protein
MFFLELSATYCFLIIGVLEANFIEPAHDKQDFERSSLYIRLEARLKQMVMDYWFVTVFSLLAVCKSWKLLGGECMCSNYFLFFPFSWGRGRCPWNPLLRYFYTVGNDLFCVSILKDWLANCKICFAFCWSCEASLENPI